MLDETMTYSCAVFERPEAALAEAQRAKRPPVCLLLELDAAGTTCSRSAAAGAASHGTLPSVHGCRVTGITISFRAGSACTRAQREGGSHSRRDPRAGLPRRRRRSPRRSSRSRWSRRSARQVGTFFATIDRVLAPGGRAAVQSILVPSSAGIATANARLDRALHLPGLPDPVARGTHAGGGAASRLEDLRRRRVGEHYAETLRRWRSNFHAQIEDVRDSATTARFERTWDFYLAFCEAAFRTRALRDAQLLLARPGPAG